MVEIENNEHRCEKCKKHPKECECWVRDDFVKRCRQAELLIDLLLLLLRKESPRVLISVFIEEIKKVTGLDSRSLSEYEGKIDQIVTVLKMSCEIDE